MHILSISNRYWLRMLVKHYHSGLLAYATAYSHQVPAYPIQRPEKSHYTLPGRTNTYSGWGNPAFPELNSCDDWSAHVSKMLHAVAELELSKSNGARGVRVFMDPSAHHILATIQVGSTLEVYQFHPSWKKARPIARLRGIPVSAVAWNTQQGSAASSGY